MALLIFDLDGTLFQTQRVTVPAVQETFLNYALPLPEADAICSFFGQPAADYEDWLARQCPPGKAQEIIEATNQRELELIGERGRLFTGTIAVMETLSKEHTLCLCSNGPQDYVQRAVQAHGLAPYLAEVVARGERKEEKTVLVAEILARQPLRPAAVIGDRQDDMEAAKANGALAIAACYGFGRQEEWKEADAALDDISDLPGVLESILCN